MLTKTILTFACVSLVPLTAMFTGVQDGGVATADSADPSAGITVSGQSSELPSLRGTSDPFASSTSFGRSYGRYFGATSEDRKRDQKITEAARALRQADSSSKREEAREALESLLSEDYDSRLKGYEEYLKQLEKRLAEMRSKLRKRRDAKADMIELRIKVLEAEADDLGWPSRMSGSLPSGIRSFGRNTQSGSR